MANDHLYQKPASVSSRRTEEKFIDLFDTPHVGISIATHDGDISVNAAFAEMLGYSRVELARKTWQELTPIEDIEPTQAMLELLLNGDRDFVHFQKRYIHKNGAWVWGDVCVKVRRGESGSPLYFITTLVDRTQQRLAEESLHGVEERFEKAFRVSPAGMAITRISDETLVNVNDSFCQIFEFSRGEVLGRNSAELNIWTPEDRDRLMKEQLKSGVLRNIELQVRAKSGKWVYVLLSSNLIEIKGEAHRITTMIDITKHRQAEEALRASEERYHMLFDYSPDGLVVATPDFFYTDANESACRMLGYSRDELIGMHASEVVAADEVQRISSALYNEIADRDDYFQEWTLRRKDGSTFVVEVIGAQMPDGNVMGILRDITERKRAEAEHEILQTQLIQAQKMESVGRLAGGVAHDFNNMLGVILGFSELAMEQLGPGSPVSTHLEEIHEAARRSANLTRQLLAFARKQTIAPKVLNLNAVIESMLKLLRRLIGEDIDLAWLPARGLWPVKVDPAQIDQILANLCINARDAIVDVGKVTIETGNAVFDEEYCAIHAGFAPGHYVLLAVSDNGCGMDDETISHLFEPFFTTKESGKGTGLGLATVYGTVKQNGGFINVYSEPGQGTTFKIYLRRYFGEIPPKSEPFPVLAQVQGHETILLVEDEPANLRMTTIMLKKEGYTVLAANAPDEAIRLAKEHLKQIHLLISDVVMPNMNGRELATRIVALYPNVKILFMSGYTANVIAHHGILDEGIHFISKPFSGTDLMAKVRRLLTP